jgi:putative membrane protein
MHGAVEDAPLARFLPRGVIGGILMGLANLVPGISGGTMLLAAGIYPTFIDAIAEVTTLRLRARPILVLGTIGGSAVLAIGLLAGPTRTLVIEQRPLMYSFFIGLTLGGLPLVWRLAQPVTRSVWIGAAAAFAVMVVMAFGSDPTAAGRSANVPLLLLSGLAGASAMILPGISGGYLLLLLGQYEPILGAIDDVKQGLLGPAGLDTARLLDAMGVVVPVGIGVVIGVVGVSNLLRWLLDRYAKATLGALLGLLLGAVVGLYPFQAPVAPGPGFALDGRVLEAHERAALPAEDWPLERFEPGPGDLLGCAASLVLGLVLTFGISRWGAREAPAPAD